LIIEEFKNYDIDKDGNISEEELIKSFFNEAKELLSKYKDDDKKRLEIQENMIKSVEEYVTFLLGKKTSSFINNKLFTNQGII
jgi:Ca2+-binding EF-hand superfamily protein